MYSGESLFIANDEGNLDEDQLRILFDWKDEFKRKHLQKIKDPHARNLVSRLLMKDPSKRPDASHALAHPFLSGKRAARMVGDEAEYDVFLSYRVNSDSHHCKLVYEMLTEKGLRVWWDKKCLQPGLNWEEGFCEGLIKSKAFVALLSRDGLQNFETLTESSSCDNVLLEYQLALELESFSLLEAVFPVMIGDSSGDCTDPRACTYTKYFESGCLPKCPAIAVKSVEVKLREHLNNQGLGAPVGSNRTVKDILQTLTAHQGGFIQGAGGDAFSVLVDSIHSMIKPARDLSGTIDGNDCKSVIISKSELSVLKSQKLELDILRSQKLELEKLLNVLTSNCRDSTIKPDRSPSQTIDENDSNSVIISKSELDALKSQKLENDVLRSQKLELEKLLNTLTSNTAGSIDWDLLMSKNRGFDILWSAISRINALTTDAAGIIDLLVQNSYSNKAMKKSIYFILFHLIYIYFMLSGRRSGFCIFRSKRCQYDECSSRVAQISRQW